MHRQAQEYARHDVEALVLDLARVRTIDPFGLHTILLLYNQLCRSKGELIIENASRELKSSFSSCGSTGVSPSAGPVGPASGVSSTSAQGSFRQRVQHAKNEEMDRRGRTQAGMPPQGHRSLRHRR
jgi:hypothetical protein